MRNVEKRIVNANNMPLTKSMWFWGIVSELKKDNLKKWKEKWQWGKPRSIEQIRAIASSIILWKKK